MLIRKIKLTTSSESFKTMRRRGLLIWALFYPKKLIKFGPNFRKLRVKNLKIGFSLVTQWSIDLARTKL